MNDLRRRPLTLLLAAALVLPAAFSSAAADKAAPAKPADKAALQWVKLPANTFKMGTAEWADASPVHEVAVKGFEIAKTPVTNAQYKACVAAGACTAVKACGNTKVGDDLPVVCVEWTQAAAFAKWVGGRLPSDSEWEYAARDAGVSAKYPWGATPGKSLTPVCSDAKTKQGVCDVAGPVAEWVQDWYHASYTGAPKDGTAWEDAGWDRVYVGGPNYYYDQGKLQSPCRRLPPATRRPDLGFRVVRS